MSDTERSWNIIPVSFAQGHGAREVSKNRNVVRRKQLEQQLSQQKTNDNQPPEPPQAA